jgi:hypothetical protein
MRSLLYSHSSIGVSLNDRKRTYVLGRSIEFLCAFMIEYEVFITWFVVMVTVFLICTSKVIINDRLTMCLQ